MTTKILVNQRSVQIFRVMLSGIFLVASFNHLLNIEKTVNRMDQASFKGIAYFFGNPELLVILSGVTMLIAGFALLIGFKTRYAAIILALVLLPITLTVQVGQINTLGPLFKNIAIMGGLIFFIFNDFSKTEKL
ncbi:MAG: DoxX family protein [Salegentibacter sp.]|uniref:Putative oxidoreductase n=1 Tax=Salegentibacter flavus TaxID=287099 RepID=A0A1I5BQA2_9FLAO|nr:MULTISPECIES: DoxX family protein [Salegentibacter]MDR9457709.1 DoxX family protein [Salegentibacter sp.]SFN76837.1 putative oxidoreductase [Salegentibacter flavus]